MQRSYSRRLPFPPQTFIDQWYEPQGKPWTLFRSPEKTSGIFDKPRGMNPKLLVRRSEREDGFNHKLLWIPDCHSGYSHES